MKKVYTVQIELVGYCSAKCEHCDWTNRPKSQQICMDTNLAKKCVKEAIELNASQISFHITGESLLHPDILEIIPTDYPSLISTNCLSLEGDLAYSLSRMSNLLIILAILWTEDNLIREKSLQNAINFLKLSPKNRGIYIQMVCSGKAMHFVKDMYNIFYQYLEKNDKIIIFYKQPYTQEPDKPTLGYFPQSIPKHPRIIIDTMNTPQSCGPDCLKTPPNPVTDIFIQSDGELKPCFKRWNNWNLGNAKDINLKDHWKSDRLDFIRKIWEQGDPQNQLACHDCIRMAIPRNEKVWWEDKNGKPLNVFKNM
jgi:MoaA/NifB/PqqE/SkfB family radical SAM enzyme